MSVLQFTDMTVKMTFSMFIVYDRVLFVIHVLLSFMFMFPSIMGAWYS